MQGKYPYASMSLATEKVQKTRLSLSRRIPSIAAKVSIPARTAELLQPGLQEFSNFQFFSPSSSSPAEQVFFLSFSQIDFVMRGPREIKQQHLARGD